MKSHFSHTGKSQNEVEKPSFPQTIDVRVDVPDFQLWQRFKNGDEAAFAKIYRDNAQILYGYGLKLVNDKDLVRDCIQDLFVEIWDSKHKLGSVRSIKAYLYKSMRRKLIRKASRKRKRFDATYEMEAVQETVPSIEVRLIEKQRFDHEHQLVVNALDKLNKKQREIIHLKYYGNMGYDEISEIMGLDKKATYNLMAHTIKLLRQDLGGVLFTFLVFLFDPDGSFLFHF